MTKVKSTKRALLSSGLALLICVSMLIGSTFAWFTDSVTSAGNIIKSGTLKVDLVDAKGKSLKGEVIEFVTDDNRAQGQILWEPGCNYETEPVYVVNKGNLALKYQIVINGIDGDAKLLEAIDWTVTIDGTKTDLSTFEDELIPGQTEKSGAIVLSGHMKETAGNEYQNLTVEGISITVFATQLASEYDSFNNTYDGAATFLNKDEAGNWLINNAGDLLYLAKSVNSGNAYNGETIKLTADIDLGGRNWTPIGNSTTSFQGIFDGQKHTVSNFKVNVVKNAGLFGVLDGRGANGAINNLTVKNATLKAGDYAGAIVGSGYNHMDNCHAVDCEITVTPFLKDDGVTYDGGAKAGGIMGRMWEAGAWEIANCSVTNVNITGYRDLGGLIGMTYDSNVVKDCAVSDSKIAYIHLEDGQKYDGNKQNENMNEIVGRVNSSATVTGSYYENVTLIKGESTSMGNSDGGVDVPEDVELPDDAKFVMTDPIIDEENKTVTIEDAYFKDANGNEVDLSNNTTPITVTIKVPFADGEIFDVYHDDKLVASVVVTDGKITYKALHFCEVTVKAFDKSKGTPVATADELVDALEKGEDVFFLNDIKIDPANMSNAYGTTGINVKNGQTIDGNGYTLNIKGAGGTWDSGINTTGGIIRNLKVTGSFRGIFVNHNSDYSETVVLENVIIEGTTYTISCDQGMNQNLKAYNCTFNGWTSFAATLGTAKFVDCNFGEGNGYAYCRPYAPTEFVGCSFEAGYNVDTQSASTFEKCTLGGVDVTADNLATLVTANIDNASVK